MNLRNAYIALHKASGIKVGDRVRILRNPASGETSWADRTWAFSSRAPGNEANVKGDDGIDGFRLDGVGYSAGYPFYCLELVNGNKKAVVSPIDELKSWSDAKRKK